MKKLVQFRSFVWTKQCNWKACCLDWLHTHTISLGCLSRCMLTTIKYNTNWMPYKPQECISQSFEGWKIQDQGSGMFSVWWEPTAWAAIFPLWPHLAERASLLLHGVFFVRAPIFITSKGPHLLMTLLWGLGFQHGNFQGTQIFTPQQRQMGRLIYNISDHFSN